MDRGSGRLGWRSDNLPRALTVPLIHHIVTGLGRPPSPLAASERPGRYQPDRRIAVRGAYSAAFAVAVRRMTEFNSATDIT